jgi:transcriptional regulator with XRE-family HTH domain
MLMIDTVSKKNYDFSVLRKLRKSQNLTIEALSRNSKVSSAVISKLERNQGSPELDTLFRLGKSLGLTATDLIAMAELRTSQHCKAQRYDSGDFNLEAISYSNTKCHYGHAKKSGKLSRPEVHSDDYEVCWVLEGEVEINLPDELHLLKKGDALQFDAVLPHSYRVLEDCQVIILHLHKDKRF